MHKYYLKKLSKQELGIKADGSVARGRYFYISKGAGDFFPFLSTTVTNDNILIPIIPSFTDAKVYCNYVYHNDKYNVPDGTRDEFRLYLNQSIDPNRNFFQINDIIIFQKVLTETPLPLYILYLMREGDEEYQKLKEIIDSFPLRGGHALIENDIPLVKERRIDTENTAILISPEIIETAKQQQAEVLENEEKGVEVTRGASLFGPDSFRDFVLMAYGNKCAITGEVIEFEKLNNLEAAHIQPKAQSGTYLPCNGIALSRDMHWAFDKGLISLNDDFSIIVHEKMKGTSLAKLNGQKVRIPLDAYFQPEKKFLKHHRENIFGLFQYSGSIRRFITNVD